MRSVAKWKCRCGSFITVCVTAATSCPPPFPCGRLMNGQSIQQIRVVGEKQTDINFERTSLDGSNDTATGQQLSTVWPSWQDAKYTTGSLCSLIEHSKWRCWHRNSFKFRLLLQRLFRSSRQITQQQTENGTMITRHTLEPQPVPLGYSIPLRLQLQLPSGVWVCVCVCVRVLLGVTTFRRKQPSVLDDRWPFTHRVGGDRPISQWQCERHVPHRRGGNNPLDGAVMKFFHWITRGAPHCVSLTTPKFATIPHNIFGKSTRKPARRKKNGLQQTCLRLGEPFCWGTGKGNHKRGLMGCNPKLNLTTICISHFSLSQVAGKGERKDRGSHTTKKGLHHTKMHRGHMFTTFLTLAKKYISGRFTSLFFLRLGIRPPSPFQPLLLMVAESPLASSWNCTSTPLCQIYCNTLGRFPTHFSP